jgi:hypothetical protein
VARRKHDALGARGKQSPTSDTASSNLPKTARPLVPCICKILDCCIPPSCRERQFAIRLPSIAGLGTPSDTLVVHNVVHLDDRPQYRSRVARFDVTAGISRPPPFQLLLTIIIARVRMLEDSRATCLKKLHMIILLPGLSSMVN